MGHGTEQAEAEHGGQHHDPAMAAIHQTHAAHSGLEAAHGALEWAELFHHGSAGAMGMGGAGLGLGMLGMPLGALSIAEGIGNFQKGNNSQGVWDMTSGGLGIASGFTGLVAGATALGGGTAAAGGGAGLAALCAAAPPLAIAAGLAGLGSYGNEYAQEHGLYGQEANGENSTFLQDIGNVAGDGWDLGKMAGNGLLGDNWAGNALGSGLGAVAGGLGGVGETLIDSTLAVGSGVARGWDAVSDW